MASGDVRAKDIQPLKLEKKGLGRGMDFPMEPMTAPAGVHMARSEPPLTAPVRSNMPPAFGRTYSRQTSQIARAASRRRRQQEVEQQAGSKWDKIRQCVV